MEVSGQFYGIAGYPHCPLNKRLYGTHRRSGRFEEEINLLPLPGIEPRFLGCPARSPVNLLLLLS